MNVIKRHKAHMKIKHDFLVIYENSTKYDNTWENFSCGIDER